MKNILVLGGSGQIGKPLCQHLTANNYKVHNVDLVLGHGHDLREKLSFAKHWIAQVDFVYFLAYDIGGAKYLQNQQSNFKFLMNNTKIMENTFELLDKSKKPFIFASSVMAEMPWSSYGSLKKLGEHFTKSLGGITTRFWNVYGPEHDDYKSHVITDFIHKAKNTKVINMMTDGTEQRQFLYAEDCSKILFTLANRYKEAKVDKKFDISNGVWSSVNEVAEIIANHFESDIKRPNTKDVVQNNSKIEPDLKPISKFWDPSTAIGLDEGIKRMIKYYEEQ